MSNKMTTKQLTTTSIFAAMVFIATYLLKIPAPNGYVHLGDCFIFMGVFLLGTKRGALAGGIGAALADLVGGYSQWILPTFFIKVIMAVIMGVFTYKLLKNKKNCWIVGAVVGGVVQIILYAVAGAFMYGWPSALSDVFGNCCQTFFGVVIAALLISALNKSGAIEKIKKTV